MSTTGKLLFTVLMCFWSFAASAQSRPDLDGVWRHAGFRCRSGQLKADWEQKEGDYVTYSFDTGAQNVRAKIGYAEGKCVDVVDFHLEIKGEAIQVKNPRIVSTNCGAKFAENQPPYNFVFGKLPSGENALFIDTASPDTCTDNGVGEAILTMIPMG